MDYFSTLFLTSGHKWNYWTIEKENQELYSIEFNSVSQKWSENGKRIKNFEEYITNNIKYIKKSQESCTKFLNLKNKIESIIDIQIKHNEIEIELNVNNKFMDLKVVIHKIFSCDEKTIKFSIVLKEDTSENRLIVEKKINQEQLFNFIIKNKHIINYKEKYSFPKREKYSDVSDDYSKFFIKRKKEERILSQSCKEIQMKFEKEPELKSLHSFVRQNLGSLVLE